MHTGYISFCPVRMLQRLDPPRYLRLGQLREHDFVRAVEPLHVSECLPIALRRAQLVAVHHAVDVQTRVVAEADVGLA